MSRRFKNLILMLLVPVGLVALFALMSSGTAGAGTQAASAADKPDHVSTGSWSDIAAFPTVTLTFGSGQYGDEGSASLKLKRGGAVAYPAQWQNLHSGRSPQGRRRRRIQPLDLGV